MRGWRSSIPIAFAISRIGLSLSRVEEAFFFIEGMLPEFVLLDSDFESVFCELLASNMDNSFWAMPTRSLFFSEVSTFAFVQVLLPHFSGFLSLHILLHLVQALLPHFSGFL